MDVVQLPKEIWSMILHKLDLASLLMFSYSSRQFRTLAQQREGRRVIDSYEIMVAGICWVRAGHPKMLKYILQACPLSGARIPLKTKEKISRAVGRFGTTKTLKLLHKFPLLADPMCYAAADACNVDMFIYAFESMEESGYGERHQECWMTIFGQALCQKSDAALRQLYEADYEINTSDYEWEEEDSISPEARKFLEDELGAKFEAEQQD